MKGSDINPLELFAEGNPKVRTKRRIVFLDPKGCKSKYVALNPNRKKIRETPVNKRAFTILASIVIFLA